MRKGGVLTVLILAALAFGITFISADAWLESNIEYQASVINEAKVEIDDLDFDLFGLSMSWSRLQVANPNDTWENSFETGEVSFNMEFWPLLWSKTVIEEVELLGFQVDTERETDGAFEIPESEGSDEPGFISSVINQVGSQAKQNAQLNIGNIKSDINVDSLMSTLNLRAPTKIDSLQNSLRSGYAEWDSTISNTRIDNEISQIQNTIGSIKVDEIKDPKKAIEALKKVKTLKEQVDSLKNRAATLKNNFQDDMSGGRYGVGQIDNWIRQDLQRAMSLAKLPDLSPQNIGKIIFGENLLGDYAGYLNYIEVARKYGGRLIQTGDDEEKRERYEGVNYEFTDKYAWPGIWVKKVNVSGRTKSDIELDGLVLHISSDQSRSGFPTTIDIKGTGRSGDRLQIEGELDYMGEKPIEHFEATYGGFSLKDTRISPSQLLPYPLISGNGTVKTRLDLQGKRIDSEIQYIADGLKFDFASVSENNRLQQLIRSAISNTSEINATALIDNIDGPLRIRLRTNLDNLFADALNKTITQEVDKARKKIESEVRSRVGDKKEQVLALKEEKESEIRTKVESVQSRVEKQLAVVEEKRESLEKKKKELEDSLKDAVKKKIGIDF